MEGGTGAQQTFTVNSWMEPASFEDDSAAPIFAFSNTEVLSWTSHWKKDWRRMQRDNEGTKRSVTTGN
jgi:hypothetical protein|uniref:Uncharacterized protein n=2 Tax=Oryza TaxID=4527 RepID=A0A0E0PFY6_ORYRU